MRAGGEFKIQNSKLSPSKLEGAVRRERSVVEFPKLTTLPKGRKGQKEQQREKKEKIFTNYSLLITN